MAAGCGHEHHHGHDDADHVKAGEGQQDILFLDVDRDQVTALNEKQTGSAAHIIRPYDQRMSDSPLLESDVDDELMVYVPFTGSVRLRSLLLRSGPGHATPRAIHLYKNTEALDFGDAANETPKPLQKLTSIPESSDVVEIPLLAARFPDVQSLTLYIPGCLGTERGVADAHTSISYLGFRGESRLLQRSGPASIVYEAAPRATDHTRVDGTAAGARPSS